MKELTVSSSSSFMLCCVRWSDMAVIEDLTETIRAHVAIKKEKT